MFIFVQQFIILDVAYNWNDKWVDNANKAESEQIKNKWLGAILFSCIVLFAVSIVSIVLLFVYYTGCTTNNTFISLTLVFCILLTMTQLSGEEGNLLSSACISAWSIFLCYSAVSKNPNDSCNPTVGNNNDYIAITIGIVITIISLCWTGWSWTAEDKLNFQQPTATTTDDADDHNNVYGCCHEDGTNTNNQNTNAAPVTGIVVGDSIGNKDNTTDSTNPQQQQVLDGNSAPDHPVSSSNTWRLNIALAMVSCWTSMVLTDWGSIQSDGTISNASTGRIAMWMIMTAQWIALTLYIWSLMAPRLFPDRDFS